MLYNTVVETGVSFVLCTIDAPEALQADCISIGVDMKVDSSGLHFNWIMSDLMDAHIQ